MNVYDFDGTIYNGDSTIDFFLFALKNKPSLITYLPPQIIGFFLYGLRKITKTQLKEYYFKFLEGIDTVRLVDRFWNENHKKIYPWYLSQQDPNDIIISASPEFLLKPICKRLGIQFLIASKVDITSGKFIGENCKGVEKVRRLEEQHNITHIENFYSDSPSDLPLAKIANHAFFVKYGKPSNWRL